MIEKRQKTCSSCETKYTVEWDIEVQDLEPLTCPFCGREVEELEDDDEEEIWTNESEDDNWN
jgi:transcription initiation factor IIE alpha subunit